MTSRPLPEIRLLHPSQLPPMSTWSDSALCAQSDPELFFPDKGEGVNTALNVCDGCPVARECLEFVMAFERISIVNPVGVWGGTTAQERRAWLRDIPRLCLTCPNERDTGSTYCAACLTRRQQARDREAYLARDWSAAS